jgi:hypothetical protein
VGFKVSTEVLNQPVAYNLSGELFAEGRRDKFLWGIMALVVEGIKYEKLWDRRVSRAERV